MSSEPNRRPPTARPRVTELDAAERGLVIEDRSVRGRDTNTGPITPDQLFVVVILWDAPETGAWIGWLTTLHHRSACFCAADLEDAQFRHWLADLPGWEPERMARALDCRGLHLVWRRSGH